MDLYVYIDESGQFSASDTGSENKASCVVAGISRYNRGMFQQRLLDATQQFNEANGTSFAFPDDMHCSPLVSARDGKGQAIATYAQIPPGIRSSFATAILNALLADDLQLAVSQTPRDRLDYDEQHTYVDNLFAVFYLTLKSLADGKLIPPDEIGRVVFTIATRRYRKDIRTNEQRLLNYLIKSCERIAEEDRNEPLLNMLKKTPLPMYGFAEEDAGLMVADFCAYFWRHKKTALQEKAGTAWLTRADAPDRRRLTAGANLLFESDLANQLADWGALYQFALDGNDTAKRDIILNRLKTTENLADLARQALNLWRVARELIDDRLADPKNLGEARTLCKALREVTVISLEQNQQHRALKDLAKVHLGSIDGLLCCANHTGDVSKQHELREAFDQALEEYQSHIGGHYNAERLRFELINKYCNIFANEYRFEEAIDIMQPIYKQLTASLPDGGQDELTGKVAGTIGQAYSFMARLEPEWAPEAQATLEESIRHFPPGSRYHAMSVNYLATLAWQQGDNGEATRWMAKHAGLGHLTTLESLWAAIPYLIAAGPDTDFDLANALRILAAEALHKHAAINLDSLHAVRQAIADKRHHPAEQLYKWLATLYLTAGHSTDAIATANDGIKLARQLDFTVHTICASIYPIAYRASGGDTSHIKNMSNWLAKLAEQSQPFSDYIEKFGGIDRIIELAQSPNDADFWQAITFPPFSYA